MKEKIFWLGLLIGLELSRLLGCYLIGGFDLFSYTVVNIVMILIIWKLCVEK